MPKIMLLIGPMGEYNGLPQIKYRWDIAEQLKDLVRPSSKLMPHKSLREELAHTVDPLISSSIIYFLAARLIIDPSKRATADEALRYPFLSS
ncbi:hypothetical protein RRF57_009423 [Xylaria bambusicola]|uniref:Protein kinase domain-containing protein n=1 Tax=Xylaria bambusicola TaxID=326684 RepID=A0AAN7V2L4_9PEZI